MKGEFNWYPTLCVLADHSPWAYWQMANGAMFWWTIGSRSELLPDRFALEPFSYTEIVSVTIIREVQIGGECYSCDWASICDALVRSPGLRVVEVNDLQMIPLQSPNEGLMLTSDEL